MSEFVFPAVPIPTLVIAGSDQRFPVHRIYCIGRNYAEHAKEMGSAVDKAAPTFFLKPADAVVPGGGDVPYPPASRDLHHEVELVAALSGGGRDLDETAALACVFGYAVGLDLTRRDLQAEAKKRGGPWDTAKGFDASAPIYTRSRYLPPSKMHGCDIDNSMISEGCILNGVKIRNSIIGLVPSTSTASSASTCFRDRCTMPVMTRGARGRGMSESRPRTARWPSSGSLRAA